MERDKAQLPGFLGKTITDPEYLTRLQNEASVQSIMGILADEDDRVVSSGHNHILTRSKSFVVKQFGDKKFKVYVYKKEETFTDPDIKRLNSVNYGLILQDVNNGVSSDPDTIRIDSGKNLIFIDSEGNFKDNDVDLVNFVGEVSSEIASTKQSRIQETKAKISDAKKRKKQERLKKIKKSWKDGALGSVAIIGTAGTIIVGTPYGIYRLVHGQYNRHVNWFDGSNPQLTDGNKILLGESDKSPTFSRNMATSGILSLRNVPMVEAGGFQDCKEKIQRCDAGKAVDQEENFVDFDFNKSVLRTIVMYSTETDLNCRSVTFNKTPPNGSNLEVWTDLGGTAKPYRAQDIKVSYKKDGIVTCWNGTQNDDNEVARVIFRFNK